MFNATYPVTGLVGANYNPRQIHSDALDRLKASISTIGFTKPIIVTQQGLIVAGHQRTKASRALGRDTCPAWVLKEIDIYDEIRFNQLHNGTDLDAIDKPVFVPPSTTSGFTMVQASAIAGDMRSIGAVVRSEICQLILKYGNWGGAVATFSGEIISSPQYALSCKMLGREARVYYIPDEHGDLARTYFQQQYGEFSYDHLVKTPWVQTFAQMYRLRENEKGQPRQSELYRGHVIPALAKTERVLDFGCGQGDYVRELTKKGYRMTGVEFFARAGNSLDTSLVHRMCDRLEFELTRNGLFDVVVCDSVMNSVDSLQAEADVMTCISAFAKRGGRVYYSGRRMEESENNRKATIDACKRRRVEFLDADGFSALYRKGAWFYQKFHSREMVFDLHKRFVHDGAPEKFATSGSWQAWGFRSIELPTDVVEGSIRREFNLPWPDGKSVGRGEQIVAAWRKAVGLDRTDLA